MRGTFYIGEGTEDWRKNDRVFIVVDEANKPAGLWEGRLLSLEKSAWRPAGGGDYHLPGVLWKRGKAVITDRCASEEYQGQEPFNHYSTYSLTSGSKYVMFKLLDAKREMEGFKGRFEIARAAFGHCSDVRFIPQAWRERARKLAGTEDMSDTK